MPRRRVESVEQLPQLLLRRLRRTEAERHARQVIEERTVELPAAVRSRRADDPGKLQLALEVQRPVSDGEELVEGRNFRIRAWHAWHVCLLPSRSGRGSRGR